MSFVNLTRRSRCNSSSRCCYRARGHFDPTWPREIWCGGDNHLTTLKRSRKTAVFLRVSHHISTDEEDYIYLIPKPTFFQQTRNLTTNPMHGRDKEQIYQVIVSTGRKTVRKTSVSTLILDEIHHIAFTHAFMVTSEVIGFWIPLYRWNGIWLEQQALCKHCIVRWKTVANGMISIIIVECRSFTRFLFLILDMFWNWHTQHSSGVGWQTRQQ